MYTKIISYALCVAGIKFTSVYLQKQSLSAVFCFYLHSDLTLKISLDVVNAQCGVSEMKTDQLTIGHQGSNGMWCPAVVGWGALIGYNSEQRYWSVRGEAKSSTQAEYPHLNVQTRQTYMRSADTWCAALKNHHLFLCAGTPVSEQIPASCRQWQWLWTATWTHTFRPSCRSRRNGEDCHRLSCLAVQIKNMFKEKLVFHNTTDSHSMHATSRSHRYMGHFLVYMSTKPGTVSKIMIFSWCQPSLFSA